MKWLNLLGGGAIGAMVSAYSGAALADTISGVLTADTTLTPAGSPYSVPGDLVVPTGITLTIEPGVTLTFASGAVSPDLGTTSQAELVVNGTLIAAGTPADPITLQATTPGRARWGGIQVLGTTSPTLRYVSSTGAFIGVRTLHPDLTLQADHLTIADCSAGVHLWFGSAVIDAVSVTNCLEGIGTVSTGTFVATNVLLVGNLTEGIYSEGGGSMTVTNATVYGTGNGTGVYGAGNLTLRNAIVTNHGTGATSGGQLLYSNFFNNQTNYGPGSSPGTGTISAEPLFAGAPTDFTLLAGSPSIDTADATGAPDHDLIDTPRPLDGDGVGGPAYDMGAFEYVRPPVCGDGLLEGTEECDDGNTASGDGCESDCTVEVVGTGGSAGAGGSGGAGGIAGAGGSAGTAGTAGSAGSGGNPNYPFCSFSPQGFGNKPSWLFAALGLLWSLRTARRRFVTVEKTGA